MREEKFKKVNNIYFFENFGNLRYNSSMISKPLALGDRQTMPKDRS